MLLMLEENRKQRELKIEEEKREELETFQQQKRYAALLEEQVFTLSKLSELDIKFPGSLHTAIQKKQYKFPIIPFALQLLYRVA